MFPAYAGVIPIAIHQLLAEVSVPRIRGGDPSVDDIKSLHTSCHCIVVEVDHEDDYVDELYPTLRYARDRWDAAVNSLQEQYPDDPLKLTTKSIMKEIERQQPFWAYDDFLKRGHTWQSDWPPAPVSYLKKWRSLNDGEKISVKALSERGGIPIIVNKEVKSAPANIDFTIWGCLWEEKSPRGNTRDAVFANLIDAKSKWTRLNLGDPVRIVYSNALGTRLDAVIINEIVEMILELAIAEVLYIQKDRIVIRIAGK